MKKKLDEKKIRSALTVGAGLILLVIAISVSRNGLFKKNNAPQNSSGNSSNDTLGLSVSQLQQRMKLDKNLVIIDIRNQESFQNEHVLDSINISASETAPYISGSGNNNNFVIIDNDGEISPKIAASIIKKNENATVYYLTGGLAQWKTEYGTLINDADPASFSDQAKVKYITSDELKSLIDRNSDIHIIDVRDNNSYGNGHIKSAVNIPLDKLEKRRKEIPLNKQIIICDDNGLLAYKASVKLFNMGTFGAKTLFDGLDSWKQKGFEVIK